MLGALVGLTATIAVALMEIEKQRRDLDVQAEANLAGVASWIDQVVRDSLVGIGAADLAPERRGPTVERVLLGLAGRLRRILLSRPDVLAVRIASPGDRGAVPLGSWPEDLEVPLAGAALFDRASGRGAISVGYPEGVEPAGQIRVQVALAAPSGRAAQDDLLDAVVFALVTGGIVLYLVAAGAVLLRGAEAQLRIRSRTRRQRLRSLAEVARGIAHEVRNPLNAISLLTQVLERSAARGITPRPEDSERIQAEVRRIEHVVDRFASVARHPELARAPFDLPQLLGELHESHRAMLEEAGIAVSLEVQGSPIIEGDAARLREAFTAIVQNATEAIGATGRGHGRVAVRIDGGRRSMRVVIEDDGDGWSPDIADRLAEPFFSTRERGLGLGLTLARILIEAHGGELTMERDGERSRARIVLPRRAAAASEGA